MSESARDLIEKLQASIQQSVDRLLELTTDDLNKTVYVEAPFGKFNVNVRAGVHSWLDEYVGHRGQIAAGRVNIDFAAIMKQGKSVTDIAKVGGRAEAARLAAEMYLRGAELISELLGYSEEHLDTVFREGEWSIRQTAGHCIEVGEFINLILDSAKS